MMCKSWQSLGTRLGWVKYEIACNATKLETVFEYLIIDPYMYSDSMEEVGV